MKRRMKGLKREKDIDLDGIFSDQEGTQEIILVSVKEREAEMAQLNDREELYSCIPPQHKDIVDIISAANISSL